MFVYTFSMSFFMAAPGKAYKNRSMKMTSSKNAKHLQRKRLLIFFKTTNLQDFQGLMNALNEESGRLQKKHKIFKYTSEICYLSQL